MRWKKALGDIVLFSIPPVFGFMSGGVPVAVMFLLLSVIWAVVITGGLTDIRKSWGLHPCADEHDYEYKKAETDRVQSRGMKPNGIVYIVYDTKIYECSRCGEQRYEHGNEREKICTSTPYDSN